jgi:hypothetical protein
MYKRSMGASEVLSFDTFTQIFKNKFKEKWKYLRTSNKGMITIQM